MKVARAVGQGFRITHKGWQVIFVLFIFNAVIRFFVAPTEAISPASRTATEWGFVFLISLVSIFGLSFLWGGVLAFARNGIKESIGGFRWFFGNCNRYFLRQLGLNIILGISLWAMFFLSAVLFGGALIVKITNLSASVVLGFISIILLILAIAFLILSSFSWTIVVAKDAKIFNAIVQSFLFVRKRFVRIVGLLSLLLVVVLAVSLIVGIIYGLSIYALRNVGITNLEIILTEFLGCVLYAYFGLLSASSFMAYYLNNEQAPEQIGAA
ncbi:MAG: hypothetical protein AMJ78_08480 [Omnitrophica WOR_2 bacterium SM23_29]|nr:MAG: hypothetical protein AMJ78_08480 [Omnitrophica WOR_2 bacterium SM23_29]